MDLTLQLKIKVSEGAVTSFEDAKSFLDKSVLFQKLLMDLQHFYLDFNLQKPRLPHFVNCPWPFEPALSLLREH